MNELEQLIFKIGSSKMLRIERWRDDGKYWRAGIEWYSQDDYEFICEYPTLLECLKKIYEFINTSQ